MTCRLSISPDILALIGIIVAALELKRPNTLGCQDLRFDAAVGTRAEQDKVFYLTTLWTTKQPGTHFDNSTLPLA